MQETSLRLNPQVNDLLKELDAFKDQWVLQKEGNPDRLLSMKKVATVESVASSTRIEGVKLSDLEVETLMSSTKMTSFESRDEQEVIGYAEIMDLVYESWHEIDLSENHILQLHNVLLRYSTKDEHHRGSYKKLENHVVAHDTEGKEIGILFRTATPLETPRKTTELVAWFLRSEEEKLHHPLIGIGMFIPRLLTIHPFQDGNGLLSRILTNLLLLRAGYTYVPYSSFERVIEDNKDLYYRSLWKTRESLKTSDPEWDDWILFFLRSMKKQKDVLALRLGIRDTQGLDSEMHPLSQDILELLQVKKRIMMKDIVASTGANKNTIKVRLRELVRDGFLEMHGKVRGTWYTRRPDTQTLL